jgi:hypothetical protein
MSEAIAGIDHSLIAYRRQLELTVTKFQGFVFHAAKCS